MNKQIAVILVSLMTSHVYAITPAYEANKKAQGLVNDKVTSEKNMLLDRAVNAIELASKEGKFETMISTKGASVAAWKELMRELYNYGYVMDAYFPHTLFIGWK